MRKQNSPVPNLDRQTFSVIPSWKQAALCALAMALSPLASHGQLKVRPEVGPSGSPMCGDRGACTTVTGDVPPLMKAYNSRRREMPSLEPFRGTHNCFERYDAESSVEGPGRI